jgi:S-DNA-T family DNA segregation ATPase FtsK/SpoIIIE
MELLVRVHRPGHEPSDLRVDIDPDQPSARLASALADHLGEAAAAVPRLLLARTGTQLDPETPVGATGIVSGDELVLGPGAPAVPPPPTPVRAVSLDVLAGPDSGQSAVLDRGTYTLGRDGTCNVVFSDATVSRLHLRVTVGADWSVIIEPQDDVQNGVLVNDVAIAETTTVVGDDVITLGSTRVAFREFIRAQDEARDRLGQIEFHRTPYRPERVQVRELKPIGPIPTRAEPRRFQALTVLAPLVAGVAMALFLGPQFLMFALLSPVAMVGSWYEDRKSGRKRNREQIEQFRAGLGKHADEVRQALAAERVERVRSAPDLADLARRAELRTIDLWCRGRHASDFLTVRLGLGDSTSLVTAKVEDRGDDDLRAEALEAVAGHDRMPGVPLQVELAAVGVLAVHGDPDQVEDVAASIAVQVACLSSPEDLIFVAALDPERRFADKLKWLPQSRSVTSPLAGRHLTTTQEGARRLLAELVEVAERRIAGADSKHDRRWPWLFVMLDGDLEPDPTLVSQLLEKCPEAGISVVWLCTSEFRVPREAAAIVDCQPARGDHAATLWHTDPEVPTQRVELGRVHPDVVDRVARSLAPVRDASVTTATTAIPRTVPLFSVLGTSNPDPAWITTKWLTERPYGLVHPIGLGPDGVFSLDLVADGPHALIGGTSGAGKSELLQSMVASLITNYPPTHLNLLFVDYKGGAASTVFRGVPHTVGYVTNLNADLAMRALTSLRAELNRRMRLLEGKAKDLAEMLLRHPDEAPASLVIVVDEFATLVKEVPDFVAGMVDIAQRGRSLGIHLILATQRPSGSVNDNILANTNLRLSLRMLDSGESTAIIGSPEAADIPVPLRGRGFARMGPRELVPFQSAYAGAPLTGDAGPRPVLVAPFAIEPADGATTVIGGDAAGTGTERTQLDAVIDAVVEASRTGNYRPSRAPWREMLPEHVALAQLRTDQRAVAPTGMAGRQVAVGIIDHPELQEQYPAVVDLEDGGGLMVFGSGGSGKTTLLRTIALSAALDASPDDLVIFGLDFASRALRSIEPLPHVSAVGTGDDLEAVSRILALLGAELEDRRRKLSQSQAETLSAYHAQGGRMPRILLLLDGYANMVATFSGGGFGNPLEQWIEALHRLVLDGRQVGIHTVIAADRRGGVPALLQSAIASRIILRQADESGYSDHGIKQSRAKTLDLAPGRGLWQADQLVQIACVGATGDARAQAEAVNEYAAGLAGQRPAIRTAPLPEVVELDAGQRAADGLATVLGLADLTLAPVVVDLGHSNMVIAGLPRSGRTTAAASIAAGLQANGADVWAIGPAASAMSDLAGLSKSVFGRADAIAPVLEELATVAESFPADLPRVLVVDDLDALDDPTLNPLWERLSRIDSLRIVATIESRSITGYSMNPMLNEVRKARRALYLQPDDPIELFQATGVRPPIRPGTPMPPGRGILLVDRKPSMVQVARPVTDPAGPR